MTRVNKNWMMKKAWEMKNKFTNSDERNLIYWKFIEYDYRWIIEPFESIQKSVGGSEDSFPFIIEKVNDRMGQNLKKMGIEVKTSNFLLVSLNWVAPGHAPITIHSIGNFKIQHVCREKWKLCSIKKSKLKSCQIWTNTKYGQ